MTVLAGTTTRWADVCAYDDLMPERGACALIDGTQVAVFRTFDGELYALP
jgi:nitrite reductase (NADH) small subunit